MLGTPSPEDAPLSGFPTSPPLPASPRSPRSAPTVFLGACPGPSHLHVCSTGQAVPRAPLTPSVLQLQVPPALDPSTRCSRASSTACLKPTSSSRPARAFCLPGGGHVTHRAAPAADGFPCCSLGATTGRAPPVPASWPGSPSLSPRAEGSLLTLATPQESPLFYFLFLNFIQSSAGVSLAPISLGRLGKPGAVFVGSLRPGSCPWTWPKGLPSPCCGLQVPARYPPPEGGTEGLGLVFGGHRRTRLSRRETVEARGWLWCLLWTLVVGNCEGLGCPGTAPPFLPFCPDCLGRHLTFS